MQQNHTTCMGHSIYFSSATTPPQGWRAFKLGRGGSFKQAHEICYLPSAVFIALMLVGPGKCLKQIIQIKPKRVKNPNWREANQLAIYKHS